MPSRVKLKNGRLVNTVNIKPYTQCVPKPRFPPSVFSVLDLSKFV